MKRNELLAKVENMVHSETIGETAGKKATYTAKCMDFITLARSKSMFDEEKITDIKNDTISKLGLDGFLAETLINW